MAFVYEMVEDRLGLQALTRPDHVQRSRMGPRVFELNLSYWESQTGYHVVFSVLIPTMLTNMIFAKHRNVPYPRRRGLVVVAVTAVAGIAMLRLTFAQSEDPGYQAPLPVVASLVVGIIALTVVALRVMPSRRTDASIMHGARTGRAASVPSPWIGEWVAGAVTLAFLGLLMPPGHPPQGPVIGEGAFVYLPMAVSAMLTIGMLVLIRRWSSSPAMTGPPSRLAGPPTRSDASLPSPRSEGPITYRTLPDGALAVGRRL
jgi:hypothetical protein